MKQLKKTFEGKGEKKGWSFEQIFASENAYLYKTTDEYGNEYYEVFKHLENDYHNCVSYPKSEAFCKWAWCTKDIDEAVKLYAELDV